MRLRINQSLVHLHHLVLNFYWDFLDFFSFFSSLSLSHFIFGSSYQAIFRPYAPLISNQKVLRVFSKFIEHPFLPHCKVLLFLLSFSYPQFGKSFKNSLHRLGTTIFPFCFSQSKPLQHIWQERLERKEFETSTLS